jgi:hypothetical protein
MKIPSAFRFMDSDEGVPTFDRAEFLDSFHHAYKAAQFGGDPFPDPKQMKINMENEDGTIDRLSFADNATNRVGFAITRRYRSEPEKGFVFLIRYMAMGPVWRDPRVSAWQRECDDGTNDVHEALFYAAAVTDVHKGEFDLDQYFENVARIAAEEEDPSPPDSTDP